MHEKFLIIASYTVQGLSLGQVVSIYVNLKELD